jgi:hypothetical protein
MAGLRINYILLRIYFLFQGDSLSAAAIKKGYGQDNIVGVFQLHTGC